MACGCQKSSASAFIVKVPGQPEQTVTSEAEAQALTRGIRGARYSAKR